MKVISPVYRKALAQVRFNRVMNVLVVIGLFVALYLVSEALKGKGF